MRLIVTFLLILQSLNCIDAFTGPRLAGVTTRRYYQSCSSSSSSSSYYQRGGSLIIPMQKANNDDDNKDENSTFACTIRQRLSQQDGTTRWTENHERNPIANSRIRQSYKIRREASVSAAGCRHSNNIIIIIIQFYHCESQRCSYKLHIRRISHVESR